MKALNEVVAELNRLIAPTELFRFYDRRAALKKGAKRWSGGLFQSVFDAGEDCSGYAIHRGGRQELQFNVGFEEGPAFRYGVAFSLEASQSLPDPVSALSPSIDRFNALVGSSPALDGLQMWSYANGTRSSNHEPGPIPSHMVRPGAFFFLGQREVLDEFGVTADMLARAVEVLRLLLPFYELVELEVSEPIPYKVARLCWNTEFWQRPSGRAGKANGRKMFEAEHGFGHEEWFLDQSRLLDGWKYGFIQALNHSHAKYAGERLNLLLYTIDQKHKGRYWVAAVSDAQALTEDEARIAQREYRKRGWLEEMREQVEQQGLDGDSLTEAPTIELMNVRYRPENLVVFDPPVQFPREVLRAAYYGTFQELPASQRDVVVGAQQCRELRERNITALTTQRNLFASTQQVDLVHKRWQMELKKSLPELLPTAKVSVEVDLDGHLVDAVVEQAGRRVLIEIKTGSIVRLVIRHALAQLLEYCYWPPLEKARADALLIVGAGLASDGDQSYLVYLRQTFGIPVHYLTYRDGGIEGIADFVTAVCREPLSEG